MNDVIARAADIAAPVFQQHGWWWTKVHGIPTAADIALELRRLANDCPPAPGDFIRCGRLMVRRGDDNELFFTLELGDSIG